MRTITKTIEVFKYAELNNNAKEKVRDDYSASIDANFFTENCEDILKELFPYSKLEVQYGLSYCQGDGFNVYGTLYLDEVLEHLKDKFTESEYTLLYNMVSDYGEAFELKYNRHASFCMIPYTDFVEGYYWDLTDDEIEFDVDLLERFNKEVKNYLEKLCADFEKSGYKYFDVTDEIVEQWAEDYNFEFYANGMIYEE